MGPIIGPLLYYVVNYNAVSVFDVNFSAMLSTHNRCYNIKLPGI